nr:hypothetical protein B0A51_01482 [Rachicladosporium sp. CCFEE 5018]
MLNALAAGVGTAFTGGRWTDLDVVCGDKTFKVHKVVVCSQSAFFETAVEGMFKEARENKIDLSADGVEAVEVMINYLHFANYTRAADTTVGADHQFVKWDMAFHIKVFALAQRCFIGGLQDMAAKRLGTLAATQWDSADFPKVVASIYDTRAGDDSQMKNTIVGVVAGHSKELCSTARWAKKFTALVKSNGEFSAALALVLASQQVKASGATPQNVGPPTVSFLGQTFDTPRFVDGKYADLTIEVGERKWKVHKFIVCSGCDFFAKACDGRFQEATANTIKMPEDDPMAVNALLEYLYTSNFVMPTDPNGAPAYRQQIALIVAVYRLA